MANKQLGKNDLRKDFLEFYLESQRKIIEEKLKKVPYLEGPIASLICKISEEYKLETKYKKHKPVTVYFKDEIKALEILLGLTDEFGAYNSDSTFHVEFYNWLSGYVSGQLGLNIYINPRQRDTGNYEVFIREESND